MSLAKPNVPRSLRSNTSRPGKHARAADKRRRGTAGHKDEARWMPEVSASGELFLRRREGPETGMPGDMNYPFSQGLTFVARRWRNLMNEELRAIGQSQARWGILYWITVFGDTVNQTELADRIGVEQPTLGRVLRDLESEGLITRSPGDGDRRAKVIRLTAAAWSSSFNSLAGALGALALMRFTDRIGPIVVALLPAIAVPFLLFIGFVPVSHVMFMTMMVLLYVFLGGSHYGIISITGTFYPTTHRALGTGWVSAAGKIGSVAGPLVGGVIMASVLASDIPAQRAFVFLALCPSVFFACMLAIGLMEQRGAIRAAE